MRARRHALGVGSLPRLRGRVQESVTAPFLSTLLVALLASLWLCGPAQALVVREVETEGATFSADNCGDSDAEVVELPPGAARPSIQAPKPGTGLAGAFPNHTATVARIATIERTNSGGRISFRFIATGSDDVCARPEVYPSGWETQEVDLKVRFQRRVRVYFAGTDHRRRYRPRVLRIGAGQRILGARWRGWGRRSTRGRGVLRLGHRNDPVALTLSRPRRCGARYHYLTLRYRFLAGPRRGQTGARALDFACTSTSSG